MPEESITQVPVPGDGTTTPVTAPVRPGPNPLRQLSARVPLHILAADDVRINRELVRQVTAYFGYQAEIVENGAEVLATLSRHPCDLILLDVQMPVMGGLETAREIVRLHPDPGQRPKMVALTASSEPVDQAVCLAAGMDDCLAKPVSPRAFEACVVRLFTGVPSARSPVAPPPGLQNPWSPPWSISRTWRQRFPGISGAQLVATQRRMHRAVTADFETIWPRVVEAISRQDQSRLAEALHALKGCFSALGWNRIAGRCAEALQRARAQQFAEWSTFPDELQTTVCGLDGGDDPASRVCQFHSGRAGKERRGREGSLARRALSKALETGGSQRRKLTDGTGDRSFNCARRPCGRQRAGHGAKRMLAACFAKPRARSPFQISANLRLPHIAQGAVRQVDAEVGLAGGLNMDRTLDVRTLRAKPSRALWLRRTTRGLRRPSAACTDNCSAPSGRR